MKQKAALFLLTIAAVLFAGCTAPAVDLPVAESARQLSQSLPFADPLEPLEMDMAARLYQIAPEDVEEAAVYVGTGGATVDEISVWKAKDAQAATRIEQAVRERVKAQENVYQDYQPQEVPKLRDPVLIVRGNVIVLCVSGYNEQARTILAEYLP